jgi:hypothetical protein
MTQRCTTCTASLSYLVGDATPYELIDPLEGGPRALVPHTEERCRFHRFLTPELRPDRPLVEPTGKRTLIAGTSGAPTPALVRFERWVRTDVPSH